MKIIINERFEATPDFNVLGIIGETNARTISVVQPKIGEANSYKLRFAYPDGVVYDVPIENDKLTVTKSLLRCNDEIQCQWIATRTDGGNVTLVAKSKIFYLRVLPSLSDDTEPVPSPEISVDALEQIMITKDQTIAAKNQAELAAAEATQNVEDTLSGYVTSAQTAAQQASQSASEVSSAVDAISQNTQDIAEINSFVGINDLLSGVVINENTDISDEEAEDAPFDDENYDYVDIVQSVSSNVLSNAIELLNGTYRFTADKKASFYMYLYDPYNGYYDFLEYVSNSSWEEVDGKFISDIEIDTDYSHNYVRVGYHTNLSSWKKYGLTLKRLPTKVLTNYEYDKLSGRIDDNKNSLQTLSASVSQNTADITTVNAQMSQNTSDILGIKTNASDLVIKNKEIKTIDDALMYGNGTAGTKENGVIIQTHTGSGANTWWRIPFKGEDITSGFVRIKLTVDEIDTKMRIYLSAYDVETGKKKNISFKVINSAGTYIYDIDLNYYVVYQNVDLNKDLEILFSSDGTALYAVYSMASLYDITNELEGTMSEVINTVNRKADSAINAASANIDVKLTDNNGDKYLVQVSNGNVIAVPLLPSNILYIGNSLLHGNGTFGMAASNSSEDYYHYVNAYLTEQGKTVNASKLSGGNFESCTTTSAQESFMTNTLLPQLNNNLDLVIIQLGDNVNNEDKLAVFPDGAKTLVQYIRTHAPNARVAWVGEWYSSTAKQTAIANACAKYGATFIDISNLHTSKNEAAIGDVITYDDGTTKAIDSTGVASHPSSVGMRAIADRIIEKLF